MFATVGTKVGIAVNVVGEKVAVVGAAVVVGTFDGGSERGSVGAAVGENVDSTICWQVVNSANCSHSKSQVPPPKQSEPSFSTTILPPSSTLDWQIWELILVTPCRSS